MHSTGVPTAANGASVRTEGSVMPSLAPASVPLATKVPTARCDTPCVRAGRCPPRCSCQNGGICQGKGVCVCPPGWMGPVCTERCAEGWFGADCSWECLCHNGGHCDPETGQCLCAAGYTGERCNEECTVGRYGVDCKGVCDCTNGARCFHIDGGCLCEAGFSGRQCSHRLCADGTYGMHCEHTCHCSPQHTLSCHPLKGECTCQPGWAGLFCNETCAHGFYGHGCLEPCLCVNGGACDVVSGLCHCAPGYTDGGVLIALSHVQRGHGVQAAMPHASAPTGADATPPTARARARRGGEERSVSSRARSAPSAQAASTNATVSMTKVATASRGSACVYLDGQSSTWSVVYAGPRCTEQCPQGSWGHQCNQSCTCLNSASCLPQSGTCLCKPGYWGAQCQHACTRGTYGEKCSQACRPCAHSTFCHHITGQCLCLPGYTGPLCDQAMAVPPERGVSEMVPVSPVERDSWGAISGIVVLVLLVVLLLALLLLYRHRQKEKQNNAPTVSFSSSRTVNSEYAVPDVPHSYHHYYSNPSYHTLSQNRPPLPHSPNNQDRVVKNTNEQLFCSLKNMERERRGLFSMETNATLPADWKHQEPPKDQGAFGMDRSYSYSSSLGKYYNKQLKDACPAVSSSSLNSENPYATIKDLPGLPPCPPESSYMEMKSAVPRVPSYTHPGPAAAPSTSLSCREQCPLRNVLEQEHQSHYDLPVNSHILGHYDLPPVRRPPSPSPRRLPC
ncbi:hypothetical protein P4O66_001374 [Electrophorus voltai]|uniref:EGF-like domain-containing protein n=1 Tax=Electrophorus voltai TaxID=2609070 RepID=A0AAD8ZBC6_9TELE|nr:hypothetical protein P4O66_001374 [Electrophorus voltai]